MTVLAIIAYDISSFNLSIIIRGLSDDSSWQLISL